MEAVRTAPRGDLALLISHRLKVNCQSGLCVQIGDLNPSQVYSVVSTVHCVKASWRLFRLEVATEEVSTVEVRSCSAVFELKHELSYKTTVKSYDASHDLYVQSVNASDFYVQKTCRFIRPTIRALAIMRFMEIRHINACTRCVNKALITLYKLYKCVKRELK